MGRDSMSQHWNVSLHIYKMRRPSFSRLQFTSLHINNWIHLLNLLISSQSSSQQFYSLVRPLTDLSPSLSLSSLILFLCNCGYCIAIVSSLLIYSISLSHHSSSHSHYSFHRPLIHLFPSLSLLMHIALLNSHGYHIAHIPYCSSACLCLFIYHFTYQLPSVVTTVPVRGLIICPTLCPPSIA